MIKEIGWYRGNIGFLCHPKKKSDLIFKATGVRETN